VNHRAPTGPNRSAASAYDMLNVDGDHTQLNLAYPSGPLPSGWGDNSGLQIQLDITLIFAERSPDRLIASLYQ
jgi:hypothetical protein